MITTCIFDLDGTLVNSLEDLADTTNVLLEKYNYQTHSLDTYKNFVGNGIDMLLQRAFGNNDVVFLKNIRKEFDAVYQKQYLQKTKPYLGIMTLLERLQQKGIKMAVVTNKEHTMAVSMVETLFPDKFLYTYGNSESYPHKPDPTLVNQVINQIGSKKEECVFIGDSDVDMKTGRNAQMKTIGVSWGFRQVEELIKNGADRIVNEPIEIEDIINDWSK
ncbi:MAG: HAD family hydrolase [Coprobacillaceae bacterium]